MQLTERLQREPELHLAGLRSHVRCDGRVRRGPLQRNHFRRPIVGDGSTIGPSAQGTDWLNGRHFCGSAAHLQSTIVVQIACHMKKQSRRDATRKPWERWHGPAPATDHDIYADRCSCIERSRRQQRHCKLLQAPVIWQKSADVQYLRGVRRADEALQALG